MKSPLPFSALALLSLCLFLSACGSLTGQIAPSEKPVNLFATLMAFDPSKGFAGDKSMENTFQKEGWSAIRADQNLYNKYLENLKRNLERHVDLAKNLGFSTDREIVGAFVWNVIEPEKGTYDWNMTDAVVSAEGKAGMAMSAVIQPFASWDQDSIPKGCQVFDFAYYDYKADAPTDWEAYKSFLTKTVERYDGDGTDDMPGLTVPVHNWEIGNEDDGTCGGNLNEAKNLFTLQKISYETIKAADPSATVLNAGALETKTTIRDIKGFWKEFFALGGGSYIDVFNLHFNQAKFGATTSTNTDFENEMNFFNTLMKSNGGEKPIWITEFGTYSGNPSSMPTPNGRQGPNTPEQSEDLQAAWHFKESIFAIANGAGKIFIDFQGSDNTNIGGAAIYSQNGTAKPFLKTLQLISKKLEGFTSVEKLAEGQYRFTVNGHAVYALWSGTVPTDLSGPVESTTMYGETESIDASEIKISADQPIFVEKN